ncbi:thiamine pyrophosphate-binding protein [Fodinicurvata sp. EGI_FJ10296]|uniref:thiamine pyrophosphate-binding protein n=1 Tax=Fodinicurvata sp. EGI_FJ10296 TaxID=3231908 RepID=UPI00345482AF
MSEIKNTSEVMVDYLVAAGIDCIFGYPGDPNIDFIEAARRREMKLVLGSREGTIGFMAEAYGMLTGRPGVCMSTLGPGSTSMVNAVANAHLDRVPMLAISGQVNTRMEPYFTHQVADHNQIFSSISKWTVNMVPGSAGQIMRKALRVAVSERPGPVHITTPADVVGAPSEDSEVFLPPMTETQTPQVFATDPANADVARRIRNARKPVILTGISALRAGATPALKRFAEATGAPVVVSPMSKGVFPEDHPLYASTVDMACNKVVWDFLAEADLLVIVGFDAVELIKPWKLNVPSVHIDSTPNTDQIYAADTEVVGNIPNILDALTGDYGNGSAKDGEARVRTHRAKLTEGFYAGRVEGRINPTDVVDAMNGTLPADTIVSTDVGSHKILVGQGWQARQPKNFLMTNGLSSMGFSLPAAIAAKIVRPDQPVVCTTGDGGFSMVQGELRFAASRGLGIMVIVFCDNSLNRIELKQMNKQYPSELTRIEPTDIVKLAEAMDCDGVKVETAAALADVVAKAPGLTRPLVVQAVVDPAQYVAQF